MQNLPRHDRHDNFSVSRIDISRATAWQDKLRRYQILVDGEPAGTIAEGAQVSLPVTPGRHQVQLKIDWCSSPELNVDVPPGGVVQLDCGPSAHPVLALLYITFYRRRYLWLEPADQAR